MIRDPFYQAIVEKLNSPLDGNLFEACSNSLLRKYYPTLVPIPGGTDSGMDGATADSGPFLVCTTHSDVIRNLTKSIESYLRSGGSRREVILAMSQALTPTRRINLENRARKLGFRMRQIYERAAMAELLYNEPRWCKELLGLSGHPPALTVFPQTERPLLDLPLIGREGLVEKLESLVDDCLIIGAPGSGKTFLLRTLALRGSGLFLVDSDKAAIANEAPRSKLRGIGRMLKSSEQFELLIMQLLVLFLPALLLYIFAYHLLVPVLSYRAYVITVCPELPSPQLLLYLCTPHKYLSCRYAFYDLHDLLRTLHRYTLNQKMHVILICPYFQKCYLVSMTDPKTDLFEFLVYFRTKYNSSVLGWADDVIQKY